jgi:hypothetical protein
VLAHIYVRRNKPKFWEVNNPTALTFEPEALIVALCLCLMLLVGGLLQTVGRTFKRPGFHNRLNAIVIRRVKNILGYPECDDDLLWPPTLAQEKHRQVEESI